MPYDITQLKNLNFRNKAWKNAVSFKDEKFVNPSELEKHQLYLFEVFKDYMIK